jgi:hypothetical protein
MISRILTLTLITAALLAAAAPAMAADTANVKLETKTTATVVQGGYAWVALTWQGDKADATDFRVTATTKDSGVEISYPDNTGSYTSLMDNDVLADDEIDFTAIRLSVPYGTESFKLDLVATWNDGGKDVSKKFSVKVPTVEHTGSDVELSTDEAGSVSVGEPTWVGVNWTGMAPTITSVEMTASGPAGAIITYPGDRSSTSLSYDDQLDKGETDVARFLLDAAGLQPGSHDFEVSLTYARGGSSNTVSGVVTVAVGG